MAREKIRTDNQGITIYCHRPAEIAIRCNLRGEDFRIEFSKLRLIVIQDFDNSRIVSNRHTPPIRVELTQNDFKCFGQFKQFVVG